MMVVNDEEYERLLKTGEWFKHPTEAKQSVRVKENEQESIKKRRGRPSKQNEIS
jgi:hypothetical protein